MEQYDEFSLIIELPPDEVAKLQRTPRENLGFTMCYDLYCRLSIRLGSENFFEAIRERHRSSQYVDRLSSGWIDNLFWLETMMSFGDVISRLTVEGDKDHIYFPPTLYSLEIEREDSLLKFTLDFDDCPFVPEGVVQRKVFISEVKAAFQRNVDQLLEVRNEMAEFEDLQSVREIFNKVDEQV